MNTYVNEVINRANNYYEYESEHVDAADAYEHVLCSIYTDGETENWYDTDVESIDSTVTIQFEHYGPEFDDDENILASIYLGQGEIEYYLSAMGEERDFTDVEAEWINRNTDWICNDGKALYRMYPSNLVVTARKA